MKNLTYTELIALADKSNAFARDIFKNWEENFPFDAKGFQYRYLYANSFRAAKSAQSFWLLYSRGFFHDAQIIARTLFERIVNSRVASKSPERACELLATNRFDDKAGVQKMIDIDPKNYNHPEMKEHLELYQREIDHFLGLSKTTKAKKRNFLEMCKEVKLEWAYRMIYREFSEYTHASFGVASKDPVEDDCKMAAFIALLAPMDTAIQYDSAFHGEERKVLADNYRALYNEFADPLLGPKAIRED